MSESCTYPIILHKHKYEIQSLQNKIPTLPSMPIEPLKPYNSDNDPSGKVFFTTIVFVFLIVVFFISEIYFLSLVFLVVVLVRLLNSHNAVVLNEKKEQKYEEAKKKYETDLLKYKNKVAELTSNEHLTEYRTQLINEVYKKKYYFQIVKDKNNKPLIGKSEGWFYQFLYSYFGEYIFTNIIQMHGYVPDFTYFDPYYNIIIDIEIDEPYDLLFRKPIHYKEIDLNRNETFTDKGWYVIRFAEEQVVKNPKGCCREIAMLLASLGVWKYMNNFVDTEGLELVDIWTREEALEMANSKYRESYLNQNLTHYKTIIPSKSEELIEAIESKENIKYIINIAKKSRKIADGIYLPNDFTDLDENYYEPFRDALISQDWHPSMYSIPKKNKELRISYYLNFEQYANRYTLGYIIYLNIKEKYSFKNIFGGVDNIFHLDEVGNYQRFFKDFLDWQKLNISYKYNYVLFLDIKNFYASINLNILIDMICKDLGTDSHSPFGFYCRSIIQFNIIPDKKIEGLIIGSNIDSFLANYYLLKVDEAIRSIENIDYGRLTDDIRIFANTKDELNKVKEILEYELSKIGLIINEEKTQLYNRQDNELNNHSKSAYWTDQLIVEHIRVENAEIDFENTWEITDYYHEITKKQKYKLLEKDVTLINNVLKNTYSTSGMYHFVASKTLQMLYISENTRVKQVAVMNIINLLESPEDIHNFIKYCILLSLFRDIPESKKMITNFKLVFNEFHVKIQEIITFNTKNEKYFPLKRIANYVRSKY